MPRLLASIAGLALAGLAQPAHAQAPAHLEAIGATERRASLGTIRAEAHVTVSDGLEYDVVTVFHDHQRAAFHRSYADRQVTLGVDGKYYWQFDGHVETEALPLYEAIVLGHQFHAQILFFDTLHAPLDAAEEIDCGQSRCLAYSGRRGHTLRVDTETRRPVGLSLARGDDPPVEVTFDRWREVDGVSLPFRLTIDDGVRVFDYRYRSVTFNEGSLDDLRAPMTLLSDEQKLLRLHRVAMDAHLLGDAAMLSGLFGPDGVVVSEGEAYEVSGADTEAMLARVFSNRDYTRYDDLIRPIVRVSEDGSLGWVIVQVDAEGVRLDEEGRPSGPLRFTSAWISMFEKLGGEWKQVGNVSNFKPDRQ